MKTIKIIDLLNKASNYEELPKKIKFNHKEFIYDEMYEDYYTKDDKLFTSCFSITELNYEVEIIEEPQEHKIPEKLNTWYGIEPVNLDSPTTFKDNSKYIDYNAEMFFNKINEILDYLEVNND